MMDWRVMSRAAREAAYNNTAAVVDSAALRAAWAVESAPLRAAWPGVLDARYGPGERACWDLFPAADPAAPCIAFIHGGYWQRGSRQESTCFGEGLRAHGWHVAVLGYTLAPQASLTAITAEVHAGLDWLAADSAAHGIAGPLLLTGWSAGGCLTTLSLGHPRVAAGLAISGVYELGPLRDTSMDATLRLTDEEIAALSPLRLPHTPKPLAIAYGSRELQAFVDDSRTLHAQRAAAHLPGALTPVPGANHFTILDALRRPDGLLVRAAIEALR